MIPGSGARGGGVRDDAGWEAPRRPLTQRASGPRAPCLGDCPPPSQPFACARRALGTPDGAHVLLRDLGRMRWAELGGERTGRPSALT